MRAFLVRSMLAVVVVVATVVNPASQAQPATAGGRPFTVALTGDSIITRHVAGRTEPAFLKLVDLVRGADAAFTNLEMLFHDYEPYPMHESGGTYMRADPAIVKDLVWFGFDLVSRANNHTGDYGVLGMQLTSRYVTEVGLVQAGVGNSLMEAREARFFDAPGGRVALVSVASTFPDHARASRSRGDMPARPGLNPLRFSTTYVVTRGQLEQLRATVRALGLNAPVQGDSLTAFRARFQVGETPSARTEARAEDITEIAAVVNSASRLADYTIVSIHGHEGGRSRTAPADFLITFARAMIDAGADVVAGHGPHVIRGIELYKGKAIFYSLGDFLFENDTVLRLPAENYERYDLGVDKHGADFADARSGGGRRGFVADSEVWEGLLALPRWSGKALMDITLYPVTMGFGQPLGVRGRPQLATGELAQKILDNAAKRSVEFGTTVSVRDGVGRIEVTR
ncbi:MAG: CapA family protein [Acidobacteriota bacterium]